MTNAFVWADDSIQPEEPGLLSCEVLDELVGKKAVFRDGWREDSTYLLYNYRDVGPYGKLTRDYLQNTIPVHAEKPHHGHADEQSICALCSGGAVLLRDGGYRDSFTTNGHYRADFYHNRLVMRNGRMFRENGFWNMLKISAIICLCVRKSCSSISLQALRSLRRGCMTISTMQTPTATSFISKRQMRS